MVQRLLDCFTEVNAQAIDDWTSLHVVAFNPNAVVLVNTVREREFDFPGYATS